MISGINFTGREEMLTKGIKNIKGYGTKELNRYVNEATIFSDQENLMAQRRIRMAKVAPQEVQRHEFISQTEPVGKIETTPTAEYIPDSMPHGMLIDINA